MTMIEGHRFIKEILIRNNFLFNIMIGYDLLYFSFRTILLPEDYHISYRNPHLLLIFHGE